MRPARFSMSVPRALPSISRSVLLGLAATAAAVGTGLSVGGSADLLAASTGAGGDSDGDGLSDLAESIYQTDLNSADSDGDGYSDLEELARGLDPLVPDSAGLVGALAVGLRASGDGQWLTAEVSCYIPDGQIQGLQLEFGAFVGIPGAAGSEPVKVPFPTALTLGNGTLAAAPGAAPGSLLLHFDVTVPQALVEALGWAPLYVTTGPVGAAPTAAAAQTLVYEGEVLLLLEPLSASSYSSAPQISGVTTRPIEPDENIPTSLSPDEVCVQQASAVGGSGGLVEVQVDSSECLPADFLFCISSCAAQVGTSRTIVDPLALIGG
jgi:hypothetical protein